jgi:hypothetical protein
LEMFMRSGLLRGSFVLAGLAATQLLLFSPSLTGKKILLPLDVLALERVYLPATAEYAGIRPRDFVLQDQVLLFEFERQFVAREFRAGRLPMWNPEIYLGAPFVVWDKYSPFSLLYSLFPAPITLAWLQLLKSLIAGMGAYVFFRRVLSVSFWPAAVGAWCYPLTGFLILWQGYPQSSVVALLPWIFLTVDEVVRQPLRWGGPVLAVLTALILIIRVDAACQLLLAAGLFALWCLWREYKPGPHVRHALLAASVTAGAWTVGFLVAAPYLLPFAEYTRFGDRLLRRQAGQEERPPGGLHELPRLVVPEVYGATRHGTRLLFMGNLLESAAAGYTGLLATLLLTPLAWCSSRHGSINAFWVGLLLLSLSWTLDVPGATSLLRAPVLKLLSHNRFVFAASFALLSLAVTGLEVIWRGGLTFRWSFVPPMLLLAALAVWCATRAMELPEALGSELVEKVLAGSPSPTVPDMATVQVARDHYFWVQTQAALLSCAGLAGWLWIYFGGTGRVWFAPALAILVLGELIWFAYDRNPQCDPALYYPRLPLLERLAESPPGRIIGMNCLPADLAMSHGLRDVRGYDSIDPRPVVELLNLARDPNSGQLQYARIQWYTPVTSDVSGAIRLPPILNMLSIRYLVYRGKPPPDVKPFLVAPDYWAVENKDALPRAFVPDQVLQAPEASELLAKLGSSTFDPKRSAYVEGVVSLPDRCRGQATVVDDTPTQVKVFAEMETPGLVVLADLWYPGWHAFRENEPAPILKTNHALRGVVVPAGRSTIVFRYEPESLALGVRLMAAGLLASGFWVGLLLWLNWRAGLPSPARDRPPAARAGESSPSGDRAPETTI